MKKNFKIILVGLILICFILGLSTQSHIFSYQDFVQYWSSGYLNLHQGYPYDPVQLLEVEQSVGYESEEPLIMYVPPWVLSIAMFFALLPYDISRAAYFVISLIIILLCAILGWEQYRSDNRYQWVPIFVLFTFYGTLHVINFGQISILLVLGICLFLYFQDRNRDYLAGLFVPLLLIKPHLVLLFIIILFFWTWRERRFRIITGALTGFMMMALIPVLANPQVYVQYLNFVNTSPLQDWAPATLATPIRILAEGNNFWIQFIPGLIGIIWAIWYWHRHQEHWNWLERAPLLLLVSLVTAAYGWSFDHPVIAIALVQISALLVKRKRLEPLHWTALIIYVSVNLYAIFANVYLHELWWISSAMLSIYLILSASLIKKILNVSLKSDRL